MNDVKDNEWQDAAKPIGPQIVGPQSGAQTMFLESEADIAIYAGPRGTGKSYAGILSIMAGLQINGYGAAVFRRESPQLTGPGSVWELSQKLFSLFDGKSRQKPTHEWKFPQYNSSVTFNHCEQDKDIQNHQGKQYAQILLEECDQFTENQFWGLYAACRSTCGIKPFMRGTCNPNPNSFLRKLVDWWIDKDGFLIDERSGVIRWMIRNEAGEIKWFDSKEESIRAYPKSLPTSFTVIKATRKDNPIMLEIDPDYDNKLSSLSPAKRASWLYGNWNAIEQGELFSRQWFKIIPMSPSNVIARVRAWDFAYTVPHAGNTDPDYTRGALVALTEDGKYIIEDIIGCRASAGTVKNLIHSIAMMDGSGVTVVLPKDAAAGAYVVEDLRKTLDGFPVKTYPIKSSKISYAEGWAPRAENGRVLLIDGEWIEEFLREAESFPNGKHDDQIDAVSLAIEALPKNTGGGAFVPESYRNSLPIPGKETNYKKPVSNYITRIKPKRAWDGM